MQTLRLIASFFALLSCLHAQNELPLFASRDAEVTLTSTDGTSLQAVIHDVWPERQQARIFVPEQGDSFIIPLDTLDSASRSLLEDWFYKRIANLNLTFKTEERLLGRAQEPKNSETLPTAPIRALNIRISDQIREKDLLVEIRNSSRYNLQDLSVTIGLRVVRDTTHSNSSSRTRLERTVRTVYHKVSLPSSSSASLESAPVQLSNYSLRYDLLTPVANPLGGLRDELVRYRAQATDRITAYYVLVHYKGELVAAEVSQQSLIRQLLDAKRDKENRQQWQNRPDVDIYDENFAHGRGGQNTFSEGTEAMQRRGPVIIAR